MHLGASASPKGNVFKPCMYEKKCVYKTLMDVDFPEPMEV